MKLSDYFDKIIIISSINSKKTEHTIDSLKKLNLYDENVNSQLYIPLKDLNINLENINGEFVQKDYWGKELHDRLSLALSHYTIIKQVYDAGLNNVLVLEDDNYFLNDISKWEEVLNNMPEDWDVMKFTGFVFSDDMNVLHINKELMFNNIFRKISYDIDSKRPNTWAWSAAAVAYNRNAMEVYLKSQEKSFRLADHISGIYEYPDDCKKDDFLNIYMPTIPLFVPLDDINNLYHCNYYVEYNEEDYI